MVRTNSEIKINNDFDCIDWYWVEPYEDGSTTWTYLSTQCGLCEPNSIVELTTDQQIIKSNCSSGGGGGGASITVPGYDAGNATGQNTEYIHNSDGSTLVKTDFINYITFGAFDKIHVEFKLGSDNYVDKTSVKVTITGFTPLTYTYDKTTWSYVGDNKSSFDLKMIYSVPFLGGIVSLPLTWTVTANLLYNEVKISN